MFSFITHTVSPACLCFDQNIPSHSFFKTRPYVMSVCWLQLVKGYTIVQDGFDAGLFRNKLGKIEFSECLLSRVDTSALNVILLMG